MPPQDDVGQQLLCNCFALVPRTYHPCCNGIENQVENSSRTFGCYFWSGRASKNCWKEVTEDITSFLENVWKELEWIRLPVTWNMTSKMNLASWILLLRLDPPQKPGPNHWGVLFSVSLWSPFCDRMSLVDRLGVWCAGARLSLKHWLVEEMPFEKTVQSYKEIYLEAP